MAPRKSVGHGRAVTGPVLDMYGSYGAHFWVPWTVVLELRAAVAAVLAESRSFDQLRQHLLTHTRTNFRTYLPKYLPTALLTSSLTYMPTPLHSPLLT